MAPGAAMTDKFDLTAAERALGVNRPRRQPVHQVQKCSPSRLSSGDRDLKFVKWMIGKFPTSLKCACKCNFLTCFEFDGDNRLFFMKAHGNPLQNREVSPIKGLAR